MNESYCFCYFFFHSIVSRLHSSRYTYIIHSHSHRNMSSLVRCHQHHFVSHFDDSDITFVDIILNDMCNLCVSKQYTRIYLFVFRCLFCCCFFFLSFFGSTRGSTPQSDTLSSIIVIQMFFFILANRIDNTRHRHTIHLK